MKQTSAAFTIAIGPRTIGAAYPVRASFAGAEVATELLLDAHTSSVAGRLIEPGASVPVGDPAALGQALGRALLTPPLRDMLLRTARRARGIGRLQIQLQIGPPELAALPWEWISIGVARPWAPALRDDYTLARISRGVRPAPPIAVRGPLRVLAIAAPGQELQLRALAGALAEPIRAGKLDLQLVDDTTPATLERALLGSPIHILHCAAPAGRTERGGPRLLLQHGMDVFDLVELLADARSLRLVTLAGPQGDATTLGAALPGLAATLISPSLPATIALGAALPARQSAQFAAACYAGLANGLPIDLAAGLGRRALADLGGERGWGAPQLRLAPGAQLFTIRGARAKRQRAALLATGALALAATLGIGARAVGIPALSARPAAGALAPTGALVVPSVEPPAVPTEPPATPTVTSQAIPAPTSYATLLTAPGDTLDQIASRLGSDSAAIAALNRLDAAAPLRAELPLVIPIYQAGQPGAGGMVIRRGNPANRKVALTFDIEIDERTLYAFLDLLRARGVHGTFFVTGRWVAAYPDAARAIVQQGHEISNHSLTHPSFARIGLDGAASELEKTEQIIHDTTGVTSRPFFRFPYGEFTAETAALVAREGYVAYHWSADDDAISGWLDWAAQHPAEANGAILLLHERPRSVAGLPGWLDQLAALGLEPTTLSDTLR